MESLVGAVGQVGDARLLVMLSLLLLYENTRDARYLDEALRLLELVEQHLFDHAAGKIVHHWIDGRPALPTDPDYFCSGCNLQTLYIIQYLLDEIADA